MMSRECPSAARLSAYCDGELSAAEVRQAEEHLAQCPACARQIEEFRRISRLIGSMESPQITQEGLDRISRSVVLTTADDTDEPRIMRIGLFLLAAAASILIICGAWLLELPARSTGPVLAHRTQPAPWELAAVNMRTPPATPDQGQTHLASDTRVIDIMLQQLHQRDLYSSLHP